MFAFMHLKLKKQITLIYLVKLLLLIKLEIIFM
jgi:hypothetical protein